MQGGEDPNRTQQIMEDKQAHKVCAAIPDMCSTLSQSESVAVEVDAIRHPISRHFPILHL